MLEKELLFRNKKLFYKCKGEGPIVIFIHGFAETSTVWENQYNVCKGLKLIFPDLPGSGRSDLQEDMSIEGLAEAIKYIIDNELPNSNANSSKITLIGHSMGGYIVLAFSEKYPDLLSGIGLFHSTAFSDSEEKKAIRLKGIHTIEKNGVSEFINNMIPSLYSTQTKKLSNSLISKQISLASNFSGDALVYYYKSMVARTDRSFILKNTNIPVLFIIGKEDNAVPLKDSLKQCYFPEIAYIYILGHSGHMGMQEQVEESNFMLDFYLNSIHSLTQ